MSRRKVLIGCFVVFVVVSGVMAEDSITLDEQTGNYIIKYEVDGEMKEAVLVPASNVSVRITPKLTISALDRIAYRYKVKVDTRTGLPLATLALNSRPIIQKTLESPAGWKSLSFPKFESDYVRLGWMREKGSPKQAEKGHIVRMFAMESDYLPGFGEIEVRGNTPILAFEGYGPSYDVAKQVDQIMKPENDSAKIITAIPAVTVSRPFDPVETLEEFYRHILDANNDARLDPYITDELVADLEVLLHDARSADADTLEDRLKEMLRKSRGHGRGKTYSDKNDGKDHLSDLVYEVIAFNVQYVLQRLRKDHSRSE